MQFQNPWGALALLLLIPLLLLYLLRQRHQEVKVPSTMLWNQVLTQWEAAHPWQKWRKNLLFFLQLLAVVLLALALMRPTWRLGGAGQNHTVLLDVSLSMQAEENGQTRLDRAKEGVRSLLGRMGNESEVTLIVSGEQNELLVSRSRDKDSLLRQLDRLEAQNGGNRMEEALEMAVAALDGGEENSEAIHVFTDREIPLQDDRAVLHNVAAGSENVAVAAMSHSRSSQDGSLSVLGLLQNYGQAKTVNVELWGDGALLDVKECRLESDTPGNVLFPGLDSSLRYLSLVVSEADGLAADNRAYLVVQDEAKYRVLLQTERNVFLEKAILLRDDIELYKTTPSDEIPQGGYSLLIGDGWAGETLPADLPVWVIGPQAGNDWFALQEAEERGEIRVPASADNSLLRYVDLTGLRAASVQGLRAEDGLTAVLAYQGETPVIIRQEREGIKRLAFGFDLHETNLPLQKDFPILVQNILEWFLPEKAGQTGQAVPGKTVPVSLQSDTASYHVQLPDGSVLRGRTERQFEETAQLGFYTVTQLNEAGEEIGTSGFAVNPLVQGESELRTAGRQDGETPGMAAELWRRWNLWPYVILLALALMALEWWVYYRGA